MADAATTLYGMVKPEVGASADSWGGKLNNDYDDLDALLGAFVLTGSSSAYVLTTGLSLAAYAAKQQFLIQWNHTNASTSPTLNVDAIGAKNIKKRDGSTSPSASDLVSGRWNRVVYDGTNIVVLDVLPSDLAAYQPLDATLTVLAALSWSSLTPLLQFTAADTVSLVSAPKVTTLELGDNTDTTLSRAGPGLLAVEGNTVAMLATANVFTAVQKISVSGVARQALRDTSASANAGIWWAYSYQGDYIISAANDAENATSDALAIRRSGATATRIEALVPFTGRIVDSSETSGALTSASRNRRVVCSGGVTLPASGMTAGDFVLIDPGGTARTITRPSAHTMYARDVDSATKTSYAHNVALAVYHGSSKWTIHGVA